MEIVGVIPARFASTRLPGKALLSETGRPLIQHVIEAARRAKSLERIIVATDDARIADAVARFGGEFMMTRTEHTTGTDRVAEVAARLEGARVLVNLQGDEPEVSLALPTASIELLENDPEAMVAARPFQIRDESIYRDPACVKVVCTTRGQAHCTSQPNSVPSRRSPRPWDRRAADRLPAPGSLRVSARFPPAAWLTSPVHPGSRRKLEQLRVLEAGYPIAVGFVDEPSIGIDTPEDYRRFVERWRAGQINPG